MALSDYIAIEVTNEQFEIELNNYLEANSNIQNIYEQHGSMFENLPCHIKCSILEALRIDTVHIYVRMPVLPE